MNASRWIKRGDVGRDPALSRFPGPVRREWMQLGGVEETRRVEERGILNRRHETHDDAQSIWVKVDEE